MIRAALLVLALAAAQPTLARTITVGPGRAVATLPEAARLARRGDTVRIDPGVYREGAVWTADALRIEAAPGAAADSVVVRGGSVLGKGLFVIQGAGDLVRGIRFEGAVVPDGNGAGIRDEGRDLKIEDCAFAGNEMGILISPPRRGNTVTVRRSRFADNRSRRADEIGHEIYAGVAIDALVVEDSRFESNQVGHYIKSRARGTVIRGNLIDDRRGSASYLIDIPQGGAARIEDNRLIRGPNPSNCCAAIAYGFEMAKGPSFQNPPGQVVVRGNRYHDTGNGGAAFFVNRSSPYNPAVVRQARPVRSGRSDRLLAALVLLGAAAAIGIRTRRAIAGERGPDAGPNP